MDLIINFCELHLFAYSQKMHFRGYFLNHSLSSFDSSAKLNSSLSLLFFAKFDLNASEFRGH